MSQRSQKATRVKAPKAPKETKEVKTLTATEHKQSSAIEAELKRAEVGTIIVFKSHVTFDWAIDGENETENRPISDKGVQQLMETFSVSLNRNNQVHYMSGTSTRENIISILKAIKHSPEVAKFTKDEDWESAGMDEFDRLKHGLLELNRQGCNPKFTREMFQELRCKEIVGQAGQHRFKALENLFPDQPEQLWWPMTIYSSPLSIGALNRLRDNAKITILPLTDGQRFRLLMQHRKRRFRLMNEIGNYQKQALAVPPELEDQADAALAAYNETLGGYVGHNNRVVGLLNNVALSDSLYETLILNGLAEDFTFGKMGDLLSMRIPEFFQSLYANMIRDWKNVFGNEIETFSLPTLRKLAGLDPKVESHRVAFGRHLGISKDGVERIMTEYYGKPERDLDEMSDDEGPGLDAADDVNDLDLEDEEDEDEDDDDDEDDEDQDSDYTDDDGDQMNNSLLKRRSIPRKATKPEKRSKGSLRVIPEKTSSDKPVNKYLTKFTMEGRFATPRDRAKAFHRWATYEKPLLTHSTISAKRRVYNTLNILISTIASWAKDSTIDSVKTRSGQGQGRRISAFATIKGAVNHREVDSNGIISMCIAILPFFNPDENALKAYRNLVVPIALGNNVLQPYFETLSEEPMFSILAYYLKEVNFSFRPNLRDGLHQMAQSVAEGTTVVGVGNEAALNKIKQAILGFRPVLSVGKAKKKKLKHEDAAAMATKLTRIMLVEYASLHFDEFRKEMSVSDMPQDDPKWSEKAKELLNIGPQNYVAELLYCPLEFQGDQWTVPLQKSTSSPTPIEVIRSRLPFNRILHPGDNPTQNALNQVKNKVFAFVDLTVDDDQAPPPSIIPEKRKVQSIQSESLLESSQTAVTSSQAPEPSSPLVLSPLRHRSPTPQRTPAIAKFINAPESLQKFFENTQIVPDTPISDLIPNTVEPTPVATRITRQTDRAKSAELLGGGKFPTQEKSAPVKDVKDKSVKSKKSNSGDGSNDEYSINWSDSAEKELQRYKPPTGPLSPTPHPKKKQKTEDKAKGPSGTSRGGASDTRLNNFLAKK